MLGCSIDSHCSVFLVWRRKNGTDIQVEAGTSHHWSVSGVMGGMFAMPGPPLVLYCISTLEDKREYVTTLQAFSVVFNLFYTIFRFKAGFYSDDTWLWWVIGLGGAIIGSSLGTRCFDVISNRMLKRIVYVMMIVSGIVAIL